MKSLKLDHELAELVRAGKKTSTWRLYDDKDIRVGDTLELVDKVEAGNPNTWKIIGTAKVSSVLEKQLRDINHDDMSPGDYFASQAVMLKDFQRYYGPQVTLDTPVKIVHFSFEEQGKVASDVVRTTSPIKELKLYADGGSRGNPGPSASGFVLMDMDNTIVVKTGVYLGITTNNQAEYQALKLALEEALRLGARDVHVYMDSLLVVNQMLGIFKVKNRDLWPIHDAIEAIKPRFHRISFTHVPRELNKLADAAVNEALDAAEKAQKARS
ncbi:MAG TPA: reverse transcriptase-like protein [Candidatus Saccharimonadales bacterium]